jgi:G6PDH family F420-dependent oxidoreductase
MYPERFWIAVGSGEALNEHITGEPWPPKAERDARLVECVQVMRNLWDGVTVTHHGRITVEKARLYTRPASPPQIFAAALTPKTARLAGAWADGLITVGMPPDGLAAVIEAFREGGGAGKRIKVQAALAWARSDAEAARMAHEQWAGNAVGTELLAILRTPEEFAAAAEFVGAEDLTRKLPIGASAQVHLDHLHRYVEMGIDDVYLFNVTKEQRAFIEFFGERVLPDLRTSAAA